jgi:hypothetical protein
MPIEIRELVIRARVEPGNGRAATPSTSDPGQGHPLRQDELIQVCVREVLRILEEKRER